MQEPAPNSASGAESLPDGRIPLKGSRRRRVLRRAGGCTLALLLGIGLLGAAALERSEALRYYLFKEISYQYLADRAWGDTATDEEGVLHLLTFVHDELMPPAARWWTGTPGTTSSAASPGATSRRLSWRPSWQSAASPPVWSC